jgi:hypothetical protein
MRHATTKKESKTMKRIELSSKEVTKAVTEYARKRNFSISIVRTCSSLRFEAMSEYRIKYNRYPELAR